LIKEYRLGTGKQCCTLVDLIERVGANHQRFRRTAINHGLREREQRFTRAAHWQHFMRRVDRGERVALRQPRCNGFAQRIAARGGGVGREATQVHHQRFLNEGRRGVLRFADRQPNRALPGRRLHAGKQLAQAFERIGLQQVEARIQIRLQAWRAVGVTGLALRIAACLLACRAALRG